MGKVFESDLVLCSVVFALADIARDQADAVTHARAVISHLQGKPQPGRPVSSDFTASPSAREMARQAEAWLEGAPIEPAARPTREVPLTYRQLRRR
jgi:selenophosphate synthetase-related protein